MIPSIASESTSTKHLVNQMCTFIEACLLKLLVITKQSRPKRHIKIVNCFMTYLFMYIKLWDTYVDILTAPGLD